jgi:hypothetical protein
MMQISNLICNPQFIRTAGTKALLLLSSLVGS